MVGIFSIVKYDRCKHFCVFDDRYMEMQDNGVRRKDEILAFVFVKKW